MIRSMPQPIESSSLVKKSVINGNASRQLAFLRRVNQIAEAMRQRSHGYKGPDIVDERVDDGIRRFMIERAFVTRRGLHPGDVSRGHGFYDKPEIRVRKSRLFTQAQQRHRHDDVGKVVNGDIRRGPFFVDEINDVVG